LTVIATIWTKAGVSPRAPAADSEDVIAARVAKAVANGGVDEDPDLFGTPVSVEVPEPLITQRAFIERQIVQRTEAGRSMNAMDKELAKIDVMIARRRPEISDEHWDFKLVDGKLKVSGLEPDDARWLEGKLNGNATLKSAVESFVATAVANLETTADANPPHMDYNYATRRMENYDFSDVAAQLAEKLSFRGLLNDAALIIDPSKFEHLEGATRGETGLSVAAQMLKPNDPPVERKGAFFVTRYGA